MLRFSLYRMVVLLCVAIMLYTVYRWCRILFEPGPEPDGRQFQHTCNMTEHYRHELERLFERLVIKGTCSVFFFYFFGAKSFTAVRFQSTPATGAARADTLPLLRDALGADTHGQDAAVAGKGRVLCAQRGADAARGGTLHTELLRERAAHPLPALGGHLPDIRARVHRPACTSVRGAGGISAR